MGGMWRQPGSQKTQGTPAATPTQLTTKPNQSQVAVHCDLPLILQLRRVLCSPLAPLDPIQTQVWFNGPVHQLVGLCLASFLLHFRGRRYRSLCNVTCATSQVMYLVTPCTCVRHASMNCRCHSLPWVLRKDQLWWPLLLHETRRTQGPCATDADCGVLLGPKYSKLSIRPTRPVEGVYNFRECPG